MEVLGTVYFKRYRDKVNGNNYFAGKIYTTINGELVQGFMPLEFQYGDEPEFIAKEILQKAFSDANVKIKSVNRGFVKMRECKDFALHA